MTNMILRYYYDLENVAPEKVTLALKKGNYYQEFEMTNDPNDNFIHQNDPLNIVYHPFTFTLDAGALHLSYGEYQYYYILEDIENNKNITESRTLDLAFDMDVMSDWFEITFGLIGFLTYGLFLFAQKSSGILQIVLLAVAFAMPIIWGLPWLLTLTLGHGQSLFNWGGEIMDPAPIAMGMGIAFLTLFAVGIVTIFLHRDFTGPTSTKKAVMAGLALGLAGALMVAIGATEIWILEIVAFIAMMFLNIWGLVTLLAILIPLAFGKSFFSGPGRLFKMFESKLTQAGIILMHVMLALFGILFICAAIWWT